MHAYFTFPPFVKSRMTWLSRQPLCIVRVLTFLTHTCTCSQDRCIYEDDHMHRFLGYRFLDVQLQKCRWYRASPPSHGSWKIAYVVSITEYQIFMFTVFILCAYMPRWTPTIAFYIDQT